MARTIARPEPPRQRIIQSKLRPPPLPEALAPRPRLETLLVNLIKRKRVLVVTATAGSGKSTAVAVAAAAVDRPLVWLTVDRSDAAPGRLLTYLEAAVATRFPAADGVASGALAAGMPQTEAAGLLAEAIGPALPTLVLDELERIGDSAGAWAIVEAIVRYLPLGACVVLISRRDVPATLCALPAPPAVAAVTDADVAFTVEEARRALAGLGSEDVDVEAAVASTAGWVTGVLFEGWRATDHLIGQGGETDPLYEYVASQILAQIDPALSDFLLATSVLDEVSATRAERLGLAGAGDALGALRPLHLPVTWHADGSVMRAHSFFREYLLTCLERRGAERLRELRLAHGRMLAAEGHTEEAVDVLLQADAPDEALAAAERAIERVVERMDLDVAERWLAALSAIDRSEPSPLTVAELMLAIARDDIGRGIAIADGLRDRDALAAASERATVLLCWCYLHHGRFDDVEALLAVAPAGPAVDAARYAMSALTDRPGGDRQPTARPVGPLGALVCIADYARGRLSALAEPSPARWSEGVEWPWRIAALRARGQTTEALAQYELASAAAWQSSAIVMVAAPELLMDAGRWAEAEAVIERGGALALQAGSPALLGLHRIHEAKLALRRRRDPEGALSALARPECIRAVERFSYMRELADTWAGLALLLAGRDRDALARLRGAVDAMVAGDRILELPFAGVFLSEAEWRAGDDEAADAAAERALDAARRQGSNHLLLQALAFFPAVVSRRVDVAQEWGEIGRALIAQGAAGAAQASITVRLLEFGRRAIVVEGEEVKPKIAKSYELLSFLLATPGAECTRDQLLEALFDARRDDSARAYLRQAIRWLRQMLPEGAFAAEGQVVRLGAGVAVTSESVELERQLAEAARLQGAERLEATLKALAIADKGPFLPGSRGGWADEREQRLADAVTEARYHAAVLAFGDGRYEESRALTRAVLEQEPLREPAWRLQMRIAQALGDSDAALRAFQNCERALREIGAEPSPSTLLLLSRARRN